MFNLEADLHKYFNFKEFRPGQKEVIESVLSGKEVLAVMPTGRGKSLCYQLPGLILPGVTLVISPLIALMKDQVDSLHNLNLHQATFLNSQLSAEEHHQRLAGIRRGEYKLIYMAPERLRTKSFNSILTDLPLELLVVDEAHCISQWGHDFRPDYLTIKDFVNGLNKRPKILALTATATPKVQGDIISQLGIQDAKKVMAGSDRPNLYLTVKRVENQEAKLVALAECLENEKNNSGIIYVATRKDSEKVSAYLMDRLHIKAGFYHAGMHAEERLNAQDNFVNDEYKVVVATNAFGMGIDKKDIRFVIHYSLPASIEAYYQEIGRAGRDGEPARCTLIYAARDRALQEWMIDNDLLTREHLVIFWKAYQRGLTNENSLISPGDLEMAGLDENRLRLIIGALERNEVLSLVDRNVDCLELKKGTNPMGPAIAQAVLKESQKHQWERKTKLNCLVNWVHAGACRRKGLLEYFGEKEKKKNPYCCDNCTFSKEEEELSFEPLEILQCVKQLSRGVGRKKLAAILQGSKAKDIIERDYHLLPYYGKLKNRSSSLVVAIIDRLLGDGYLLSDGETYPVLDLTSKGMEAIYLANPLPLPIEAQKSRHEKQKTSAKKESSQLDNELLTALREYRSSLAKKMQLPPFMVLQDRTLRDIASNKPRTLEHLAIIAGIGVKKLSDYGKDLLAIVGYHSK